MLKNSVVVFNRDIEYYVGNNPVKYVDPDGRFVNTAADTLMSSANSDSVLGTSTELINKVGCVLTTYTRIASAIAGKEFSLEEANNEAIKLGLFDNKNLLSPEDGAALITALVNDPDIKVEFLGSIERVSVLDYARAVYVLNTFDNRELFLTARILTTGPTESSPYGHTLNINAGAVFIDPNTGEFNIKLSDTSGANRQQINNDVRTNTFERIDVFQVIDSSREI